MIIIGVVMKDPPPKDFQTIALQETNGYQQQNFGEEETNFANFDQASAQPPPPAQNANPFKNQGGAQNNPFRN